MTHYKHFLFTFFLLYISYTSFPQRKTSYSPPFDSLLSLEQIIVSSPYEFVRLNASDRLQKILIQELENPETYHYSFDTLKLVTRLQSPDKRFNIFTWHVKRDNWTYLYYGIIQWWNKSQSKPEIVILNDKTSEIKTPETRILEPGKWYGAHYYKIILTKQKRKSYYTLLGWKGADYLVTRKVIDVITFENNQFKFGYPIFKNEKKKLTRHIFEFSSEVSMVLRYEDQYFEIVKNRNPKIKRKPVNPNTGNFKALTRDIEKRKPKIIKKKAKMIVFDHLEPIENGLENIPQFNTPALKTHDGYIFSKGRWRFIADVEARNPKPPKQKKSQQSKPIQKK